MVIRRVTGEDWKTYVRTHILQPAGMNRTRARVPSPDADAALPFEAGASRPMMFRKTDATLHAAGGLYSTLPDMGRWLTLFTDPGQTRLPAADIREASRPLLDGLERNMGPFRMQGYGYGWIHGHLFGAPLHFHFGRFPGYDSMISYDPQHHIGVFVYVNVRQGGLRVAGALTALFHAIERDLPDLPARSAMLTHVVDQAFAGKQAPMPATLTRNELPGLCGRYVSPRYGTLSITRAAHGYRIRLGSLSSSAYRSTKPGRIGIAWIPGKREYLDMQRPANGRMQLEYQDYGTFVRVSTGNMDCGKPH
jgi:hypothetical protein